MSLRQLAQLLPLPDDELQQVLDYASALTKPAAADHFRNLLGDSPQAVEFISTFNGRRRDPQPPPASAPSSASTTTSQIEPVPKSKRAPKKKQPLLHTPAPRQVDDSGPVPGAAYTKKTQEDDYIAKRWAASAQPSRASGSSSDQEVVQTKKPSATFLAPDPVPKAKPRSNPVSRTSTPKPSTTTKVSITGGMPMTGASSALADLDAAIRALEMTTNPTLKDDIEARRCDCVATRHPLQTAAPNCLSCGKVICMKEGLGPCTFCGSPLLSSEDVQGIIQELKADRSREKMAVDREHHKRPEVAKTPAPFAAQRRAMAEEERRRMAEAEAKALEHRDKLLGFQAQNARRTTIRDEAADFDVSLAVMGQGSMWSSPEERARELKKQQKLMREMEWSARPDYEKRRQVVSIDLVGGRVVRKMAAVERPPSPEAEEAQTVLEETSGNRGIDTAAGGGGAFSKNPLLGGLVKPVYDAKGKGAEAGAAGQRQTRWRRVQDDLGDNEAVLLDGGVRSHGPTSDEPECG